MSAWRLANRRENAAAPTYTSRAVGSRAVLAVALLATALAGAPPSACEAAEPVAEGRVARVIDGDTVALDGGQEVRLVGIQAPKLPLGRAGFEAWPLARESQRALESLARGRRVALAYGGRKVDRHGRLLAHLTGEDGTWLQGEMLRRGLARVYTFADNRARAAEMLAFEGAARAARRGIWADPHYAVRAAANAPGPVGTFQLVEGTVLAAGRAGGRVFLNFGRDWRSDFTVAIASRDFARFGGAEAARSAYDKKRVRARGWIERRNGPMIVATHPEQIEVLGP